MPVNPANIPAAKDDRVPTGVRSLYILEVLAKSGIPMTPTQINTVLQLPKPTIHRLCQRLETEGFLEKDLDGRHYLPGVRLLGITSGVTGFVSFSQARHAALKQLSEQVGETCNITVPVQEGMRYLDRVETRWPLRFQFPIGECVPFHCTASGKLYLSTLRKSQRKTLVKALSLDQLTRNTITEPGQLLEELDRIRRNKIGIDNEEFVDGMVAVAVPVEDENGRLIATLALHAPTLRMSIGDTLENIDYIRAAAIRIQDIFLGSRADAGDSIP